MNKIPLILVSFYAKGVPMERFLYHKEANAQRKYLELAKEHVLDPIINSMVDIDEVIEFNAFDVVRNKVNEQDQEEKCLTYDYLVTEDLPDELNLSPKIQN